MCMKYWPKVPDAQETHIYVAYIITYITYITYVAYIITKTVVSLRKNMMEKIEFCGRWNGKYDIMANDQKKENDR